MKRKPKWSRRLPPAYLSLPRVEVGWPSSPRSLGQELELVVPEKSCRWTKRLSSSPGLATHL